MNGWARGPVLWDVGVAALFTALLIGEAIAEDAGWAALPVAATLGLSLLARRSRPLASFLVSSAMLLTLAGVAYDAGVYPLAHLVGTFSVGAHATRNGAAIGLVAGLGSVAAYWAISPPPLFAALPVIVVSGWALAWAAGQTDATRRRQLEAARARAAEDAHRREAAAKVAVADERARIAREVHDVVGHSVNVMLLQAGAARRMLDHDPEAASRALRTVEAVGRETLGELDGVLDLLGSDGGTQPGIADVDALVQRFRDAGMPVGLQLELPTGHRLSPTAQLSVYRIVQEALTNVAKHAPTSRETQVRVLPDDDALRVEVLDVGAGLVTVGGARPAGRGVAGIRERVGALGGEVLVGPRDAEGWAVRCRIPMSP